MSWANSTAPPTCAMIHFWLFPDGKSDAMENWRSLFLRIPSILLNPVEKHQANCKSIYFREWSSFNAKIKILLTPELDGNKMKAAGMLSI